TARKASLINEGSLRPPFSAASRLSRLRLSCSMISCASLKNSSRALSPISGTVLTLVGLRSFQLLHHFLAERLGTERLREVARCAELESSLHVLLGFLRRNQQHWGRTVTVVLPHELQELETIDVRHVDIGDDQVVGPPGQQPQGVEAAPRFDDFDVF